MWPKSSQMEFGTHLTKSHDEYESCLLGRMKKEPFIRPCDSSKYLLEILKTDVCRPFRSTTRYRNIYTS